MVANMIRGWNVMPRYRKLIIGLLGLGLVVFGYWTISPLFYNRGVDEAFPVAAPASQAVMVATAVPAMAEAAAMAATAVPAMAVSAAMGAEAAPTAMADPVAPAVPAVLTAGMFISGSAPGHHVDGKATIYRLEDGKPLLRLEDFSATNGPDLFVVLSSSANPDQDGVKTGAYLQLEALKGNIGNQNYELPADIDPSQYKSIVIWCRTFNVVFGYAPLQSTS